MRRAQRSKHCGRGYRIGRCDDRADRNRSRPRHRRHEQMNDESDRRGCESDGENHEAGNRRPIVPEIS